MSSWGTGIKQIDEFMDVYDEFFELYKDNAVAMDIYQTILKAWRCAPEDSGQVQLPSSPRGECTL